MRVPWTARKSNQSVLKEINLIFRGRTDAEAEASIFWLPDAKIASEAWQLRWRRSNAERSYPMSKVRGSGQEELPHVQGKEQWLCFAGAAMKRYPTSKVRETQVRW